MGLREVMDRSNAAVVVLSAGSVTVRGRELVERVSWAKAVVHIVRAARTSAKKDHWGGRSGRGGLKFLDGELFPESRFTGNVISLSLSCGSCFASLCFGIDW